MKAKRVEAQFGDLVASGTTKAEAKKKVMEIAETFCQGSHDPIVRRMGPYLYIVSRNPENWQYQVLDLREEGVPFRGYTLVATKGEAIQSVEYHAACLLADDGMAIEEVAALITNTGCKMDFLDYWAWQECYKRTDAELPDMERRKAADENRHAYFEANYRRYVA